MIEDEKQITIKDEEGNEHLMEILFTYEHDERKKKSVYCPTDKVDSSYSYHCHSIFLYWDLECEQFERINKTCFSDWSSSVFQSI